MVTREVAEETGCDAVVDSRVILQPGLSDHRNVGIFYGSGSPCWLESIAAVCHL